MNKNVIMPSYKRAQGSNHSVVGNCSFHIYKFGFECSTNEAKWLGYF